MSLCRMLPCRHPHQGTDLYLVIHVGSPHRLPSMPTAASTSCLASLPCRGCGARAIPHTPQVSRRAAKHTQPQGRRSLVSAGSGVGVGARLDNVRARQRRRAGQSGVARAGVPWRRCSGGAGVRRTVLQPNSGPLSFHQAPGEVQLPPRGWFEGFMGWAHRHHRHLALPSSPCPSVPCPPFMLVLSSCLSRFHDTIQTVRHVHTTVMWAASTGACARRPRYLARHALPDHALAWARHAAGSTVHLLLFAMVAFA